MDLAAARDNMVQQQIKTWQVLDPILLAILNDIPREIFVPSEYQSAAYSDGFIPLYEQQVMLPPLLVGRMVQALDLNKRSKVLEIGSGTGYVSLILARLAQSVDSFEIEAKQLAIAKQVLKSYKQINLHLYLGDGLRAEEIKKSYDAILVNGSIFVPPIHLKEALSIGGKMIIVTGTAPAMCLQKITRISSQDWQTNTILETNIPRLLNTTEPNSFSF